MPAAAIASAARTWSATMRSEPLLVRRHRRRFDRERLADGGRQRSELVGVPDRAVPLQDHRDALETHAGVDVAVLELVQRPVVVSQVRHEDVVPHLDEFGAFDEPRGPPRRRRRRRSRCQARHRPTGPLDHQFSSAPIIVRCRAGSSPAASNSSLQIAARLGVDRNLVVSGEHRDVKLRRIDAVVPDEQLPGLRDRRLLEVVAEAPVSEHLEDGQVGVVTDLVDVGT